MLKKSLLAFLQSGIRYWKNLPTVNKIILTLSITTFLGSLGYYLYSQSQKTQIAEISVPVTPPVTSPTNSPSIVWITPYVSMVADNLTISTNTTGNNTPNKIFTANPNNINNFTLHSDPALNHHDYTTLEATWIENNVEMRLFMYFTATGQGSARTWHLTKIQTYNGNQSGNWIDSYSGGQVLYQSNSMGSELYIPYLHMSTSGGGYFDLIFDNLHLQAFTNEQVYTSPGPSQPPACSNQEVTHFGYREPCDNSQYHYLDYTCGNESTPRTIGDAYYCNLDSSLMSGAEFYCRQNSCGTPPPSTTPTCTRHQPSLTISPSSPQGYPSSTVVLSATLTNNDSEACGSSDFALAYQIPPNFGVSFSQSPINLSPGANAAITIQVTTSQQEPSGTSQTYPLTFIATNNQSSQGVSTSAGYKLLQSITQDFRLNLSLMGVNDDSADGALISVKFVIKDSGTMSLSEPIALKHLYDNVYQANFRLGQALSAGTKYRIKIKGEKHIGVTFCNPNSQTTPCSEDEYLTIPSYSNQQIDLNFTSLPLPPGDLSPQDGKADYQDITKLKTLMGKIQSTLTPANLAVGDLNYDGHINNFDIYLILKSMDTRYDQ